MSQIFDGQKDGKAVPATLIEAGPCYISQIKKKDKDGYEAFQIGFIKKTKKIKKTEKGKEFKFVREFRVVEKANVGSVVDEAKVSSSPSPTNVGSVVDEAKVSSSPSPTNVGSVVDVSVFKEGDKVKISGISKGKGFQGAVKRWGFSGRNATHGVKHEQRTLGSVGSSFPERVIKGRKMPGRTGSERTTIKNLEVIKVDKENNILAVKGAVPGARGTLLEIRG